MIALSEPGHQARPRTVSDHFDSLTSNWSSELFYIDDCSLGLGVFAKRRIAPGEFILRFDGPIIDFAETKRRGPRECMAIQIGFDRYLDTRPPGVFVNHSCDPNAGIRGDRHLVALRAIRAGEEIRYDYSTTMAEQSFTMQCACGAPVCRKVVEDFSRLPEDIRKHHLRRGTVMSFISGRAGGRMG
jgi:hypothetical protein